MSDTAALVRRVRARRDLPPPHMRRAIRKALRRAILKLRRKGIRKADSMAATKVVEAEATVAAATSDHVAPFDHAVGS